MRTEDTYLAVFVGSKNNPKMAAWNAMSEAERGARMQAGIAAWQAWMQTHKAAIVGDGGPLGRTKKISDRGIEDVSNLLGGYTLVRAPSHEAAAGMFEQHPHFTIFPGEAVEVMPVLPIPGA